MTAHIFISGRVRGVGFRHFIKYNANKLNLTGWVKNLPDGTVEAIIQGDRENVEKLVDLAWKGPFLAEVKNVVVTEEETSNFEIFEVIS